MKHIVGQIGRAFINLVYPPICLSCKDGILDETHLLCEDCLLLMELIDPVERCPHCFSIDYVPDHGVCTDCVRKPPVLQGIAAAFDYVGPAACLVKKLKYGDLPYLSKGCAAFLAAQFLRLEWPLPDVIIPVPIARTHLLERGYNQSLLLAKDLGEILCCPIKEALYRKSGDYSQAGLSRRQRMELDGAYIQLKTELKQELHDKCVLLVDDVMTTGSTMRKCAEALFEKSPAAIYGLAVCRAIK